MYSICISMETISSTHVYIYRLVSVPIIQPLVCLFTKVTNDSDYGLVWLCEISACMRLLATLVLYHNSQCVVPLHLQLTSVKVLDFGKCFGLRLDNPHST